MKILFVFNHHAGTGISTNTLSMTVDSLLSKGISVRYAPSYELQMEGAITREEFLSYDRILCSGGDGTLSQLINRLYELDILSKCNIGYIPSGSTNDYAASLSIPSVPTEALATALGDRCGSADLGVFNGKTFTYVAAFGLFCEVSYSTDQNLKNMLGHSAYIISGARSLFSIKPCHARISVDGQCIEDDFILCAISNSRQIGGFKGFFDEGIALDDGFFEVTLIRNITDITGLSDLAGLFMAQDPAGLLTAQNADDSESQGVICRLKGSDITIESDEDIDWTLDGEYGGSYRSASICVKKKGINIYH